MESGHPPLDDATDHHKPASSRYVQLLQTFSKVSNFGSCLARLCHLPPTTQPAKVTPPAGFRSCPVMRLPLLDSHSSRIPVPEVPHVDRREREPSGLKKQRGKTPAAQIEQTAARSGLALLTGRFRASIGEHSRHGLRQTFGRTAVSRAMCGQRAALHESMGRSSTQRLLTASATRLSRAALFGHGTLGPPAVPKHSERHSCPRRA